MKANAVGKKLSEVEKAYVAGFLDADGAIMASLERHQEKKFGFRVRVVVKISQRDIKVVEKFRDDFGVGRVRPNRHGTRLMSHEWIVLDQQHADYVLKTLLPYIRVKEKQAKIAREIIAISKETRVGLIKAAELGDTLSRFNTRTKRKNFATILTIDEDTSPLTTNRTF